MAERRDRRTASCHGQGDAAIELLILAKATTNNVRIARLSSTVGPVTLSHLFDLECRLRAELGTF